LDFAYSVTLREANNHFSFKLHPLSFEIHEAKHSTQLFPFSYSVFCGASSQYLSESICLTCNHGTPSV